MISSPTTNVSFMSRLYSHMNYSRIEAKQCSSTPPSQLTRSVSILSIGVLPACSVEKEGFYATTELFQQGTETNELRKICSTKLNRINHLACGQFGDDVSSIIYLVVTVLSKNLNRKFVSKKKKKTLLKKKYLH